MKAFSSLFLLGASLAWTQSAPPAQPAQPVKPDTVIAIFEDGYKLTQGEFDTLVSVLPENLHQYAETNQQGFLHWYGVTRKAAAAFKSQGLPDKDPWKAGLEFAVMERMADYYVQQNASAITISSEEIQKFYDDHKELYRRVKVSGLMVGIGAPAADPSAASTELASRPTRKALSEDEAKAKAEKLAADIRGGADFAKLEQSENDDAALKAKGGELGTWGMTDNLPDLFRSNVLTLKEGEVSDPIRQANGFYLIHCDAVTYAPLADVKDAIFAQIQHDKGSEWLKKLDEDTKVEIPGKDPAPAPSDPKK